MNFQADCRNYINELTTPLNNEMSVVFATWSNQDNRVPSFQRSARCPVVSPECAADKKVAISDVSFLRSGSIQDPPAIRQALFVPVEVTTHDVDAQVSNLWVKGQDGTNMDPAVSGREITVYEDDRAYIWESSDDSSVANVYTHNMFGGNLNFTVDVSNMEASCAGGLALVNLNDTTCNESDVEDGNCTPTEVFSANKYGFAYGVGSCTFGTGQFGSD